MTVKRKYSAITCPGPDCYKSFYPKRSNQVFCKNKCRENYNNDKRKLTDLPFNEKKKRIKENDKVLEKAYLTIQQQQSQTISHDMLLVAGYDFDAYMATNLNDETQGIVYWNLRYGIEPFEQSRKLFLIHKNEI